MLPSRRLYKNMLLLPYTFVSNLYNIKCIITLYFVMQFKLIIFNFVLDIKLIKK